MVSPRNTISSGNNGVIRIGKEGNDTIMGSPGRDALYGGPGDDLIVGSPAPDRIFGNAGSDTIDYSGLGAAISVNMAAATVSGGDADGDRLVGIERVILTDHDDIATGDDADNRLEGRGGTDTLDGGNGNDTLIGGAGADSIRFGRASGRDRVVLDGSDTAIDVIQLGAGIAFDQLWYHRIGPDLAVSVLGTKAMIVVQDFFGKPARRAVSLRTEAGETLDATGLVALEAVLTGQTRPDQSQDRLPPALRHQLDPVLRTVWNGVPAFGMTKEVLANADYTTNHQWRPAIAALAGGGYVVAWRDEAGQDGDYVGMFAQRFDKHGARVGKQFQANTHTESAQHWAAVTGLPDGGFVIVWMSFLQDKSEHGVFGQRFSADGRKVGAEFQAHTHTSGSQRDPTIASLPTGGFVIAWSSYAAQDGSSFGVFAQRFAADGSRAGVEFQVNTHTRDAQHRPVVAALADDGFVIVWESDKQDGSKFGIFGQRYAADGSKVGSEFQANTHTASIQNRPTVTGLAGGGFVVLWESLDQDGSGEGIYGQVFDRNGRAVGAEFRANSHTASDQMRPAVTALDDGGFLAMWDSPGQDGSAEGIFGQRFAADGTRVGSEFQVNSHASNLQANAEVAPLGDGGIAAVWESEIRSNDYDITTRVLESPPTLSDIGDADGNVLPASGTRPARQVGTNGNDTLSGGDTRDVLIGKGGNDSLAGGGGRDRVRGGRGNDTLSGGAGRDILLGDQGNDVLSGDADRDRLRGGTGNDTLTGGGGADRYEFARGDGADRIDNADIAQKRDTLAFQSGIKHDQLWFARSGQDLVVSVIGTADTVTVAEWYTSADNRHLTITTADGKASLADSQVQALVNAMASHAPSALGTLTLSSTPHGTVDMVIAASWQLGG